MLNWLGGVAGAMKRKSIGVCSSCGFADSCPICGSKLVEVKYSGHNRSMLAVTESDGFVGFLGCLRVELHDKVVDGVSYRGKVFVRPLFRKRSERSELSNGSE
jgi:hypothetical protein